MIYGWYVRIIPGQLERVSSIRGCSVSSQKVLEGQPKTSLVPRCFRARHRTLALSPASSGHRHPSVGGPRLGTTRAAAWSRQYRVLVEPHGAQEAGLLAVSKASGSDIHPVVM